MLNEGNSIAHGVAIVVDGCFGARLPGLASRLHVWLLDTQGNRVAANGVWRTSNTDPLLETGVTTFRADPESKPDEIVSSMLSTIDLHHGEYGHLPPWSRVSAGDAKGLFFRLSSQNY